MKELFFTFLEKRDRDSYLAVRSELVESEHYDPYSSEMENIDELLNARKFEEARATLAQSMPNLLLSPRAHLIMSYIANELNDEEGANLEGYVAAACCEGILATGDGTKENPYLVIRTSDEHDLVRYLEKGFKAQSLIEDGDRVMDLIECEDGTELWFDITEPYRRLERQFGDES